MESNQHKKESNRLIPKMLLLALSISQALAVETSSLNAPNWGLAPVVGTLLKPGIAVHTSGTLITPGVTADVDHSLKLFDIRAASLASNHPIQDVDSHVHHHWDTASIGNVYGLAIDNDRNIYTTASTHYGAFFGWAGANQTKITFGSIGASLAGDTPEIDNNPGSLNDLSAAGTIYKIDAVTGNATIFATLPQQAHSFSHPAYEAGDTVALNTEPSLGNITYDPIHNQLFISNFEDGKIYRYNLNGTQLSIFDPGTADDASAGFSGTSTDPAPYGLAVNPTGTKLYYGTHAVNQTPAIFAIDLDTSGNFSGSEIDQLAQIGTELSYTQDIGEKYVEGDAWLSFSDLQFTPKGELIAGLRMGCKGNFTTPHNHGGTFYLLKKDRNGLYNTPVDKVSGTGTSSYSEVLEHHTIAPLNRADNARYDARSIPTYTERTSVVGNISSGPDDGYGGVAIYDKGNGSDDYLITTGDMIVDNEPHGFMLFPDNFTIDLSTDNIISPVVAFGSIPSSTIGSADREYKGIGGSYLIITEENIFLGVSVDNEGGINHFPNLLPDDTSYTIPIANISATNSSDSSARDEYTSSSVANNASTIETNLFWSGEGISNIISEAAYVRFIITNDSVINASSPNDFTANGEVEDYLPSILEAMGIDSFIWEDTDDSNIASSTGNAHTSGLFILNNDAEPNAVNSHIAGSDDADNGDGNKENMTVDFGFIAAGMSLGDFIWWDADGNGTRGNTAGEPGISSVVVKLFAPDGSTPAIDVNGTNVPSTLTDSDGSYSFANLPAGDYVVQITPPMGYELTGGGGADPDDDNADSNGILTSGGKIQSLPVTLSTSNKPTDDGDSNLSVDFGLLKFDLALRTTINSTSDIPLRPGSSTVTLNIVVFNQGNIDAADVEIVNFIHSGFSYDPVSNTAVATGNGNDWSLDADPTLIIPGIIPAGSSVIVKIILDVEAGTSGQLLTSTAEIIDDGLHDDVDSTPDATDGNEVLVKDELNNTSGDEDDHDIATIEVSTFDLALKTSVSSQSHPILIPGVSTVTFSIEVTNQGDIDASDVHIVDYIMSGFTYDEVDNTSIATGNTHSWGIAPNPELVIDSLNVGETKIVYITLGIDTGTSGQTLNNFAEIAEDGQAVDSDIDSTPDTANTEKPVKDNITSENGKGVVGEDEDDHDVAMVTVDAFDLALRTEVGILSDTPLLPGVSQVTFTIEVINQDDIDAQDITLVDYIQSGFSYDPVTNTAIATGNSTDWSTDAKPTLLLPGTLAAGGSTTVKIILDVDAGTEGQTIYHYAEIADDNQPIGTDIDSTPDSNDDEDPVIDNVINQDGKHPPTDDEDDHDITSVVPSLAGLTTGNHL